MFLTDVLVTLRYPPHAWQCQRHPGCGLIEAAAPVRRVIIDRVACRFEPEAPYRSFPEGALVINALVTTKIKYSQVGWPERNKLDSVILYMIIPIVVYIAINMMGPLSSATRRSKRKSVTNKNSVVRISPTIPS